MAPITSPSHILISGVSGFVGIWCAQEALSRGHRVRGTVRSAKKGEYVKALFDRQWPGKFEWEIAEDLEKPGVFDNAVKDVDAVLHTASPFHFNSEDDPQGKLIKPAVRGTLNILNSIHAHGKKVKRVIITSSFAAILDVKAPPGTVFTEKDWNRTDVEKAEKLGNKQKGPSAYLASKAMAERAAWDFVAEKKPTWDLGTICPPIVLGPFIHECSSPESLNTSILAAYLPLKGAMSEKALLIPQGPFVDVRDVAFAHLEALSSPQGAQRFGICAPYGSFTWQDGVDEIFASDKITDQDRKDAKKGSTGQGRKVKQNTLDPSLGIKVLGMKYRNLRETLEGTVGSIRDYEKRDWKGLPSDTLISQAPLARL